MAVSLGPLAGGLGKGYSSPAIASLQGNATFDRPFTVSNQEASWVASLSMLGEILILYKKKNNESHKELQ